MKRVIVQDAIAFSVYVYNLCTAYTAKEEWASWRASERTNDYAPINTDKEQCSIGIRKGSAHNSDCYKASFESQLTYRIPCPFTCFVSSLFLCDTEIERKLDV